MSSVVKPLGGKAYGHIPHLPGSRMGPGDHQISVGQSNICTKQLRDKHDRVIVTEKLDGSNCAVAKIDGRIIPLIRSGYIASSSKYLQHNMFYTWVYENFEKFDDVLSEGEWLVGEWLAQAHGTLYDLPHEPFVVFDIISGVDKRGYIRAPYDEFVKRLKNKFVLPVVIHDGSPYTIKEVEEYFGKNGSGHGAIDPVEGAVWRVERRGEVDFLAKWVRTDKEDGKYLPSVSFKGEVWNTVNGVSCKDMFNKGR